MKNIHPPGLPEPVRDQTERKGILTTWDMLALAIGEDYPHYGERINVVWTRYAWLQWCCGSRMRMAVIHTQDEATTFGWKLGSWGYLACRRCGRITHKH